MLDNSKRKLTAIGIKKIKPVDKTKKYSDAYGMYLEVRPNGSKYWRYSYRLAGKQKTISLGVYPIISLAEARKLHEQAYMLVVHNTDPSEAKKAESLALNNDAKNSFEALCIEWIQFYMANKSAGHKVRAERLLFKHLAKLKNRPINSITQLELLEILREIEARGTVDTAHRCRSTAAQVFAYAVQTGRATSNPARDLIGALETSAVKHRATILEPKKIGRLLVDIDNASCRLVTKSALQLSAILFQRPGEIRQMEWAEIDFEKKLWSIPAEKMKMRIAHLVPLPKQAMHLLYEIRPLTSASKYIFPSARGNSRCMSDGATRTALRDMGYSKEEITPHGFRAMARTLLDEVLGYRVDWIEQQLAHTVKDANGTAYNRTKHLKQRTEMMQTWADYLDNLKEGYYQK